MDRDERARLRALCEAATPGPWREVADRYAVWEGGDPQGRFVERWRISGPDGASAADAALTAAARTALPALLDDLDAAERDRDGFIGTLDDLMNLAWVAAGGDMHDGPSGGNAVCERISEIVRERDALRAELARLREPRPSAIVLRPVDTMTRGLPCACDEWGQGHLDGCPNGGAESVDAPLPWDDEDQMLADGDLRALDAVTRERDEARAEMERLRAERDAALRGLRAQADVAAQVEREACAAIADAMAAWAAEHSFGVGREEGARTIAAQSRARGAGGAE